ncbi:hypothetical protein [Natronosalvus rutilus]|uniref:DUF8163 domain-containing protein n=1 Tax=Natronosalvus rutilus TaxID=2953753 RepID=A0A9E7SUJ2_9EURY|nr:hypothetical protein [Natronosalvus rutilus]UTF54834.1 hypothetical protein NGM29_06095 [Natronosalvus rutilus]
MSGQSGTATAEEADETQMRPPRVTDPGRPGGRPAGIALAIITVAMGVVAGPLGAIGGGVTAAGWYLLGTPYAIAIAHVALVVLFPSGLSLLSIGLLEAGVLTLVLAAATGERYPLRFAVTALVGVITLGGLTAVLVHTQPLWLAALGLVVAAGVLAYGLHRVELVQLGLVTDSVAEPTDETPTET